MEINTMISSFLQIYGISAEEQMLTDLSSIFTMTFCRKHGRIYSVGDAVDKVHFALSGYAMGFNALNDGSSEFGCLVSPGFAAVPRSFSIIEENPADQNIVALTDCTFITASIADLRRMMERYPALRDGYAKINEKIMMSHIDRVRLYAAKDAYERCTWYCENMPDLMKKADKKDLAVIIGVTPVHMSRLSTRYEIEHPGFMNS